VHFLIEIVGMLMTNSSITEDADENMNSTAVQYCNLIGALIAQVY